MYSRHQLLFNEFSQFDYLYVVLLSTLPFSLSMITCETMINIFRNGGFNNKRKPNFLHY